MACCCKILFYPLCICKMLELVPSTSGFPRGRLWWAPTAGAVTAGDGHAQDGLGVPYLGPWVLRLPTDCVERLPAKLGLVGEDQPADDPSQDLMLSAGSRLSTEPTLEQASLRGETRLR